MTEHAISASPSGHYPVERAASSRDDVEAVAHRFAVPGASRILEQVIAAVDEWPQQADEAGMPEADTEIIATHIDLWSKPLR